MKVKLQLGYDISYGLPYIRIDYYKSVKAFINPIDHPHECFSSICAIDTFDPSKKYATFLENILIQIEMSIDVLFIESNKEENE